MKTSYCVLLLSFSVFKLCFSQFSCGVHSCISTGGCIITKLNKTCTESGGRHCIPDFYNSSQRDRNINFKPLNLRADIELMTWMISWSPPKSYYSGFVILILSTLADNIYNIDMFYLNVKEIQSNKVTLSCSPFDPSQLNQICVQTLPKSRFIREQKPDTDDDTCHQFSKKELQEDYHTWEEEIAYIDNYEYYITPDHHQQTDNNTDSFHIMGWISVAVGLAIVISITVTLYCLRHHIKKLKCFKDRRHKRRRNSMKIDESVANANTDTNKCPIHGAEDYHSNKGTKLYDFHSVNCEDYLSKRVKESLIETPRDRIQSTKVQVKDNETELERKLMDINFQ